MRLSPLDIQQMEFQRGAGGYQRKAVRAFLDRIGLELEELLREHQALRAELERRDETIAELQTAEAELQRAIIAAERIGNEIKMNAQREAELMLQEAENLKQERLREVDARLHGARAEITRLEREHSLFRDQFRGMLEAYARSLEIRPAQRPFDGPAGLSGPGPDTAQHADGGRDEAAREGHEDTFEDGSPGDYGPAA